RSPTCSTCDVRSTRISGHPCSRGTRTPGSDSGPAQSAGPTSSNHVFEALEGGDLDSLPRRLGLDHDLLAGERVLAEARLGGGLLHDADLHQARHREFVGGPERLLDDPVELVEDGPHVFLRQVGLLGDLRDDLRLGRRLCLLYGHLVLLPFFVLMMMGLPWRAGPVCLSPCRTVAGTGSRAAWSCL